MGITEYRIFPALCAILLAACGGGSRAEFAFPEMVGAWKLKSSTAIEAGAAPETIRGLGLKRAQRAEYEGAGRITAEVYEMASSAAALEAEQTWKASADTVAFHRNEYFVVIHWENVDRNGVSAFVREMEKLVGR